MHKATWMFIFIDWWGHKLNNYDLLVFASVPYCLSGGSKGGAAGDQILSISCSFWENLAKLYVGAPPPNPRGNHRSATGCFYPWVMCILTVRMTEAFGLPKLGLLVSIYVVCARLSVMQRLPESGRGRICAQIGKNTLFWDLVQNP